MTISFVTLEIDDELDQEEEHDGSSEDDADGGKPLQFIRAVDKIYCALTL